MGEAEKRIAARRKAELERAGQSPPDRTVAVFGGLSVIGTTALVGLMASPLPVFWPMLALTLFLAWTISVALLNWDKVQTRRRHVRILIAVFVVCVMVGVMVKPLRAQYVKDAKESLTPTERPAVAPPKNPDPLTTGVDFQMKPLWDRDVVAGDAMGRAQTEGGGDFLRVSVSKFILTTPKWSPAQRVKSVRLGVAHWNRDYALVQGSNWHAEHWSNPINVNQTIGSNSSRTFPGFEESFPVRALSARDKSWLVLEIEIVGQQKAYAHSQRGLFDCDCD